MKKIASILFFIPFLAFSQSEIQIDSIRKRITSSKSDSLKAIEYLEIANRHIQKDSIFKNLNLSLEFARKAKIPKYISNSRVNLSNWYNNHVSKNASINEHLNAIKELESYNFKSGIANHYIRLGYRYNSTNQDSADVFIRKGVTIAKESKDDNVIVTGLLALGNRAFYDSKFEKALEYYIEAETICNNNTLLKHSVKHAGVFEYIGYVMQRANQHQKTVSYFKKSLAIYEQNGNEKSIINMQTNIAEQYFQLKDYKSAIPLLNKTIAYNNTLTIQKNHNIGAYLKRAYCYEKTNAPEQAEKDYLKAFELSMLDQNKHYLKNSLISIANFYLNQKNYGKAEIYFLEAEVIGKNENDNALLEKAYKGLANIKAAEKEFEEALKYASEASKMDEIEKQTNLSEKIIELETKYQSEKKEQEIELLKAKNEVSEKQKYIYIAIAGLLLLSGLFLFLGYRNKLKMAQKLKELNELKSRFFANISHEFRTPLTLIKSPVQTLKTLADASQQTQLDLIENNSSRMLELVDQLLELSKIDSGHLKLILKQGHLSAFLNSIVEPFIYQSKELQKPLIIDIEQTSTNLLYDKDVIEKIVSNLLSNALKYGDTNESIRFASKIVDGNLQLSVSNNNSHLTSQDLPKLFERFYQTNTSNDGTGIGLALVKELVQLYEGKIATNLDNRELRFKVTLPLHPNLKNALIRPTLGEVENENAEAIENNNDLPILLVVDDHPDIRTVITSIFESEFRVINAKNGKEALALAQKEIPDCIISDIMMPEIDGFEFSRKIKSNELTSFIPIILVTAKTSDAAHLEALQSTADAYLTKPFNHEVLKATVKQQIQERKKLQVLYSQELILKPTEVFINSVDEKFINRLQEVFQQELANTDFNTEIFANKMNMSRMQLHRKLKSLFGISATEFVRNERLKTAADLMKNKKLSISEIAYGVGFNDLYYFSKCFKDLYKVAPSEYQKSL